MTTGFKSIFIDTNILVYISLSDFDSVKHLESLKILNDLNKDETGLYISTQVIREFYAVDTNQKYLMKPLSPKQANAQIDFLKKEFNVLVINEHVISILQSLLLKFNIKSQAVHDTTIVATMKNFGLSNLLTYNKKDFTKFKEINIIVPQHS